MESIESHHISCCSRLYFAIVECSAHVENRPVKQTSSGVTAAVCRQGSRVRFFCVCVDAVVDLSPARALPGLGEIRGQAAGAVHAFHRAHHEGVQRRPALPDVARQVVRAVGERPLGVRHRDTEQQGAAAEQKVSTSVAAREHVDGAEEESAARPLQSLEQLKGLNKPTFKTKRRGEFLANILHG